MERTFSIIKPDAVERNLQGEIMAMIQAAGLRIVGMKMIHLTKAQAEGFYAVHRERPFFASLTEYMCSGPAWSCAWKGRMPFRSTAISWAQPTRTMLLKARSAKNTPWILKKIPVTAQMDQTRQPRKFPISLTHWSWWANETFRADWTGQYGRGHC